MNMKRIERKGRIFQTVIAICVVCSMVLASSSISYAAIPTLDSEFATLIVGTNDLKVENYDGSQTMAGCFTAPEKGDYSFYVVNIGELRQDGFLLNEDFAQFSSYTYLDTTEQHTFGTYSFEKGEKIYFYVLRTHTYNTGTLATRFVIQKEEKKSDVQVSSKPANTTNNNTTTVNKAKVSISQKSCSLKKGKKIKLILKNNKEKVIWISREKKIASVTSKGVVKGRKKGTTYIYAIANHELYKCKVKIY